MVISAQHRQTGDLPGPCKTRTDRAQW
jgi:hypothetical protein